MRIGLLDMTAHDEEGAMTFSGLAKVRWNGLTP